ncbi:ShlB/FhaC/HecB family hemolysin secretion/activation protein [Mangrovicoccus sp. HB161399]|uniref:ShlB/FhaC/HecB family hemolysin secretion/activation protein n=1 Tax=Mangrovicoccus sp. HB161399 TaxID=2720392 RepID=UPI0015532556|nr:ShlB/FhaC/HecB family hemolysin secretion/activation protein [Mangrovicoccus sp. HB161399]
MTSPAQRAARRLRGPLLLAVLAAPVAAVPAAAQTVSALDRAVAGQTTILERFAPPPRVGQVDLAVQDQKARMPGPEAEKVRFRLASVGLAGARTVPADSLAPLWQDMIGTEISLADLYGLADRIDAAYRQAGYFSATVVPVQDFRGGEVTLRVYEGYLQRVEVTSSIPGIDLRLRPYIDRLMAMNPIRIAEAERVLLLMADLGGLEINGTFLRPDTPTGGGVLELEVGQVRSSGMVGLDNLGTDEVGPLELSGTLVLNDMLGLFETTTLVAVTVPDSPEEMGLLQLSQDFPVGHDGMTAGYGLTYLAQQPGGDLEELDVEVETAIGSAYLAYPFLRRLDRSLTGRMEITLRNDDVDMLGMAQLRSRTRWATLGLRYDREFELGGYSAGAEIGHGLDTADLRQEVPAGYRFLRLDLDANRSLSEHTLLRLRAAGQHAPQALPAAVQFALGGDPYGWAFDNGSLAGDSGAGAALELSHGFATGIGALPELTATAFADYGAVWSDDAAAEQDGATLGSAGFGISGMLAGRATFQLVAAAPWQADDSLDDPGPRLFFRVALPF